MKLEEFDKTLINEFVRDLLDKDNQFPTDLKEHFWYIFETNAPRREKTFLMLQSGEIFGVPQKELVPFAAAAELLLAAAFNADESIDGNTIRFGNKTLWTKIGKDETHIISNNMYGLIFDMFVARGYFDNENSRKAFTLLLSYFTKMHIGQYQTMTVSQKLRAFSMDDMYTLAFQKAGLLFSYTFATPAILSESSHVATAKKFGELFGIALQYSSDIRDFWKMPGELDKKEVRMEDFKTHQPNLVLVLTAQSKNISSADREIFLDLWEKGSDTSEATTKKILAIIEQSDAIPEAFGVMKKLHQELLEHLQILPNHDAHEGIRDLVNRVCFISNT